MVQQSDQRRPKHQADSRGDTRGWQGTRHWHSLDPRPKCSQQRGQNGCLGPCSGTRVSSHEGRGAETSVSKHSPCPPPSVPAGREPRGGAAAGAGLAHESGGRRAARGRKTCPSLERCVSPHPQRANSGGRGWRRASRGRRRAPLLEHPQTLGWLPQHPAHQKGGFQGPAVRCCHRPLPATPRDHVGVFLCLEAAACLSLPLRVAGLPGGWGKD